MGWCVTPKAQAPKEEPGTVGFSVKSFREISTVAHVSITSTQEAGAAGSWV